MIRLSRLTPELRAALITQPLALSSAMWVEAGMLELAELSRVPKGERGGWTLNAEGHAVRAHLRAQAVAVVDA